MEMIVKSVYVFNNKEVINMIIFGHYLPNDDGQKGLPRCFSLGHFRSDVNVQKESVRK